MMDLDPQQLRLFWWTARERQTILLRRAEGLPREEWTQDATFASHHFCNVFRSDDRVSAAILLMAQAWGDPWGAALAGRLVNRYETIREMTRLRCAPYPLDLYWYARGSGLNTNAYRLNTPAGLNSVVGVAQMYREGLPLGAEVRAQKSVPEALKVMGRVKHLGGFVGYQVVLDLIELGAFGPGFVDDWAWPGPGAMRGVSRMLGREVSGSWEERRFQSWGPKPAELELQHAVMTSLREASRDPDNWPADWQPWGIHEVEGWLCEYDKWARRANGESAGGRKYKGRYGVDYTPAKRKITA